MCGKVTMYSSLSGGHVHAISCMCSLMAHSHMVLRAQEDVVGMIVTSINCRCCAVRLRLAMPGFLNDLTRCQCTVCMPEVLLPSKG